jgi:adenosylhomocysteine nucleosidase
MALYNKGYGPVGCLAKPPVDLLLCFAVKEEMKFFRDPADGIPMRGKGAGAGRKEAVSSIRDRARDAGVTQVWVTGIGRKNAASNIREALAKVRPERVITAGFAGGLNPTLKVATVIYEEDFGAGFGQELEKLGALPAKFYCHRRVAITAAEKRLLYQQSGADAVEMESSVIRTICHEFKVPSATVRVISDDASHDLPLDFNALMTSEDRIDYHKLFWTILRRPSRIFRLMEFQQQTLAAARQLGGVLEDLLRVERRRTDL